MIDKETQRIVWNCLPKEFKEEVKKRYNDVLFTDYDSGYRDALTNLFGGNNLTSDADGEEMLCISKKRVQEMYKNNCDEIRRENISSSDKDCYEYANEVLKTLFGSKCLPDKKDCATCQDKTCKNYDAVNGHCRFIEDCKYEPKPAEPKFAKGDMIHCKSFGYEGDYRVLEYYGSPRNCYDCIDKYGAYYRFYESDLEPYTEPEDNPIPSNSTELKSHEADKHFDTILKDGFSKERRLNIAAMAMQGILANSHQELVDMKIEQVAQLSLEMTDALIAEAEKGGSNGED